MAKPLRFRRSRESWNSGRVADRIHKPLDDNLGAAMTAPWFSPPDGYEARRFEVENGDTALFAWNGDGGWWLGNTETPEVLWRTNKQSFAEAPYDVSAWAQREFIAELHEDAPFLEPYPYLSWFFLPVFCSKDGRETTREFFAEHAGGFPDASSEAALDFYESFLQTGVFDDYRHVMAGKLGTSEFLDVARANGAMGEFNAAWLLREAGYDVTPEIEVSTGHSLDYRADRDGEHGVLVEVTRPVPTNDRAAHTPVAAVKDTAQTKTSGQLDRHGGGAVLFVDCSSFPDDEWHQIRGEKPEVHHRPAVVFRVRPDGSVEGYTKGSVPLDLPQL
ncbi:DUF5784 family protein [Halobacterium litoreum]|uniref:DUF5784 family protein n=1 Tax=Halobacterium litoreum TaxID=2039234 RepID=A0ABD5NC58_9EURY|nr:DUF5784 family protein [Halobacterium litoreum]UHH14249.1 DUF5784 family protein [Halobacterium litoreum]